MGTLLNLGVNAAVATVIYSSQQAGVGPATIGLVTTTIGVGMLDRHDRRRLMVLGGLLGAGLIGVLVVAFLAGVLGTGQDAAGQGAGHAPERPCRRDQPGQGRLAGDHERDEGTAKPYTDRTRCRR